MRVSPLGSVLFWWLTGPPSRPPVVVTTSSPFFSSPIAPPVISRFSFFLLTKTTLEMKALTSLDHPSVGEFVHSAGKGRDSCLFVSCLPGSSQALFFPPPFPFSSKLSHAMTTCPFVMLVYLLSRGTLFPYSERSTAARRIPEFFFSLFFKPRAEAVSLSPLMSPRQTSDPFQVRKDPFPLCNCSRPPFLEIVCGCGSPYSGLFFLSSFCFR